MSERRVLVGITGASGAVYGRDLLEALARSPEVGEVAVIVSDAGRRVLKEEIGAQVAGDDANFPQWLRLDEAGLAKLRFYPIDEIGAAPASGSHPFEALAVAPCSMRTLSAVAHGLADNLLTRAADVAIKEGRRVVLAPRETPLSALHLENMLRLARLGVRIVPPCPGFYHGPQKVEDLVRFVVQRIVNQMGLEFPDPIQWE